MRDAKFKKRECETNGSMFGRGLARAAFADRTNKFQAKRRASVRGLPLLVLAPLASLALVSVSRAVASADEMFKSINAGVSEPVDSTRFVAGAVMVIAVIVVSAVIVNKFKRPAGKPAGLNHSGRLLKEISQRCRIRPAQLRQLKAMANEKGVESPLTLILCPSLRTKPTKTTGA